MKGLPWRPDVELHLGRYYTEVAMLAADMADGSILSVENICSKDFFKPCKGETIPPTRLLIHGAPGSGKSVLASKLAYDWACDEPTYSSFNIVLILSAIECTLDNFNTAMLKALDMPYLADKDVLGVICSPSTRMLIIIDDYDRNTTIAEGQLLPVIRKEQLSQATVVVISRSGKLSSTNGKSSKFPKKTCSSGMDIARFLHRRVTLLGYSNSDQMNEFVKNHLCNILEPKITWHTVSKKVNDIIKLWHHNTTDFVISPLDLLLLILALTDLSSGDESLTEIHKNIFTLKVQRYLSKVGDYPVANLNLFDINEATPDDYVKIVLNFCNFANKVLCTHMVSFSREEILSGNDGHTVLDLGFITEVTNNDGKRQKLLYKPINRVLFEFATAYFFWKMFISIPIENWDKERKYLFFSLRPRMESTSSLWFSFLVGLLQNNQIQLFKSLTPFAAEFSQHFGSLCYSLLETSVTETTATETLQKLILPMLPVLWKIPWENNEAFSRSLHHTELLRFGLESAKIKIVRWNARQAVHKSTDLKVDRLMLELQDPIQKWSTWECNLSCNELHCLISGVFGDTAEDNWQEFLRRICSIDFTCLSFEVKADASHDWLPLICQDIKSGRLTGKKIRWLLCDLDKQKDELIQTLIELVKYNKIKGLQLALCGQDIPDLTERNTTCQNSGAQGDGTNKQIGQLVAAAASSKLLKRLVIINSDETITIDLGNLCNQGKKSWKWVHLIGVRVEYKITPGSIRLKIQSLDISRAVVSEEAEKNLMGCKIKSLACSMMLLTRGNKESAILKSLKGIDVKVDECVYNPNLPPKLQNLAKLQVLALTMAPLDKRKEPIPLRKWIMGTHNFLPLKGFEVWSTEVNLQLATNLVESVLASVTGSQPLDEIQQLKRSSALPPLQLKLKYLLVNLGLVHEDEKNEDHITRFVKLIRQVRRILKDKLLPQLEIVCSDEVVKEMSKVKPCGMISWVDVFPAEENFQVSHDFWGMSVEGPFRSREIFKSCPGVYNRFCVTFGDGVRK